MMNYIKISLGFALLFAVGCQPEGNIGRLQTVTGACSGLTPGSDSYFACALQACNPQYDAYGNVTSNSCGSFSYNGEYGFAALVNYAASLSPASSCSSQVPTAQTCSTGCSFSFWLNQCFYTNGVPKPTNVCANNTNPAGILTMLTGWEPICYTGGSTTCSSGQAQCNGVCCAGGQTCTDNVCTTPVVQPSAECLGGTTWTVLPGWLDNLSVSKNGDLWGVNSTQSINTAHDQEDIYYWNLNSAGWAQPGDGGQLIQISVGLQGISQLPVVFGIGLAPTRNPILGVNDNNVYYRQGILAPGTAGSSWVLTPGQCRWVSVSNFGKAWCINASGVSTWNSGTNAWTSMDASSTSAGGSRIAAKELLPPGGTGAPVSVVYILDSQGSIWAALGSSLSGGANSWTFVASGFQDMSLGADGSLWVITSNNTVQVKSVSPSNLVGTSFIPVATNATPRAISAGGAGQVFYLSNAQPSAGNNIYRRGGFICP